MKKIKKKKSKGAAVTIAVLMFLSALLSFVNRVYDRKQIIKAIAADEDIKLIVASSSKEKL